MAFAFGKTLGRHKILPSISPSKTWEGFIGAAISTLVAASFLLESRDDALLMGLVVSIIGPFGGFLASLIKRAYLEKDFGTWFQGHGGFVDRLDCHIILAPIVFIYLSLTKNKQ
jgi:phosphatidate cytidylyltransferase